MIVRKTIFKNRLVIGIVFAAVLFGCGNKEKLFLLSGKIERTCRDFLYYQDIEPEGFGLYSYVLFLREPSSNTEEKYLNIIKRYITFIEKDLIQERHSLRELNLTFLPLIIMRSDVGKYDLADPAVILKLYDYSRARQISQKIESCSVEEACIISSLVPLTSLKAPLKKNYIIQDLSVENIEIVRRWMDIFFEKVNSPGKWNRLKMIAFTEQMRYHLCVLGKGINAVYGKIVVWQKIISVK